MSWPSPNFHGCLGQGGPSWACLAPAGIGARESRVVLKGFFFISFLRFLNPVRWPKITFISRKTSKEYFFKIRKETEGINPQAPTIATVLTQGLLMVG